MAIISFNNQALSAFGQSPSNLSWSLSNTGTYKTVQLLTTGTGALDSPVLSAKKVRGIVFNTLTSPASGSGTFASLSAYPGTSFRVDTSYNGQTMGLIYDDGSSTIFTVVTGATTTKQSLTANGFDTTYPEVKRLWLLGYR